MLKFGDWLSEFKDVDRPIGDLANDMISQNDVDTFNKVTSVEDLPSHLSNTARVVAAQAFNYYLIDALEQ